MEPMLAQRPTGRRSRLFEVDWGYSEAVASAGQRHVVQRSWVSERCQKCLREGLLLLRNCYCSEGEDAGPGSVDFDLQVGKLRVGLESWGLVQEDYSSSLDQLASGRRRRTKQQALIELTEQ